MPVSSMHRDADLSALVERLQGPLQWYLRYCGCPAREVPDLVQETFLRLFARMSDDAFEERDPKATAAWLRKTARHLWLQRVGSRGRDPVLHDPQAAEAVWIRFEGEDGGESWRHALRRCLGRLKDRPRRAIDLQYAEGLSRKEVAGRLGLSEAGVKTLLARTREALRNCVEREVER